MWYYATTWRGNYWRVLLTRRGGWAWKRQCDFPGTNIVQRLSSAGFACAPPSVSSLAVPAPCSAGHSLLHRYLHLLCWHHPPGPSLLSVGWRASWHSLPEPQVEITLFPTSVLADPVHPERFGLAQENRIFIKIGILYQKGLLHSKCSYCGCIL